MKESPEKYVRVPVRVNPNEALIFEEDTTGVTVTVHPVNQPEPSNTGVGVDTVPLENVTVGVLTTFPVECTPCCCGDIGFGKVMVTTWGFPSAVNDVGETATYGAAASSVGFTM